MEDLSGLDLVQKMVKGTQSVPLHDYMGFVFTKASEGLLEAECQLDPSKHGNGINGFGHGGLIAAFSDAVGGFACVTTLPRAVPLPAMADLHVKFTDKVNMDGCKLKAVGRVTHNPGSSALVETTIHQGERLVSHAVGTVILPKLKNDLP